MMVGAVLMLSEAMCRFSGRLTQYIRRKIYLFAVNKVRVKNVRMEKSTEIRQHYETILVVGS